MLVLLMMACGGPAPLPQPNPPPVWPMENIQVGVDAPTEEAPAPSEELAEEPQVAPDAAEPAEAAPTEGVDAGAAPGEGGDDTPSDAPPSD